MNESNTNKEKKRQREKKRNTTQTGRVQPKEAKLKEEVKPTLMVVSSEDVMSVWPLWMNLQ